MSIKPDFRIFTAGGCGLKLAHNQIDIPNVKGFVKPMVAVFDSSKSDVDSSINLSNHQISHYFLNEDGMGKNRAMAAEIIRPHIKPFIDGNEPGKVNVVMFGLSGGTGSVAGPMIVKDLLTRGENVIAIIVANTTNQKEAANSLSTLNDLKKMPETLGVPLSIMYYENTNGSKTHHVNAGLPSQVDNFICRDIRAIACMVSGQHKGIDSKDVTNLLNFQNVTRIKPRLVELCPSDDFEVLEDYQDNVISQLLLTKSKDTFAPDVNATYQVHGTWMPEILETVDGEVAPDLVFATTAAMIPIIFDSLKTDVKRLNESAKAVQNVGIVDDEDLDDLVDDVGI